MMIDRKHRTSWLALAGVVSALGCGNGNSAAPSGPTAVPSTTAPDHKKPPQPVPAPDDPWAPGAGTPDRSDDSDIPTLADTRKLAERACPRVVAPYFYRVTRGTKVNYLLGTRHLGVSLAKMPTVVRDRLKAAKLIVFEVAPDDHSTADDPPPAQRLPDALGSATWQHYRELAGGDIADQVADGPPERALLMLVMLYEYKLDLLDVEIQNFARTNKIATAGLEASAFQDRLIHELLDIRMLKATIDGTKTRDELKQESERDLAEYCAGTDNDPGMDAKSRDQLRKAGYSDAEIAKFDQKLVFDRNNAWLPQLDAIFAAGDAVIVVGADHLVGDRGVAAQLAKRGYQVDRVTKP